MTLLEVRDLEVGYGLLPVIHGLSFSVEEGSTTVLLGLNGAGKTTMINTIAGLLSPWKGEIIFDDVRIDGLPADRVVEMGIALSPEGRRVFPGLSVRTNLELGAWTSRRGMHRTIERVYGYFPVLEERATQLAGTLSGGEQQMLAIGRALMASPKLLLVDEASLGLAPIITEMLFAVLHQITEDGTTAIVVEQNVGVLSIADRALVMEKGRIIEDAPAAQLARSGEMRKVYLGDIKERAG